jgi:hypothetical protein
MSPDRTYIIRTMCEMLKCTHRNNDRYNYDADIILVTPALKPQKHQRLKRKQLCYDIAHYGEIFSLLRGS